MPYVFHTKTIQSILDPIAQQVARLVALHNEAEHGRIISDLRAPIAAVSAAVMNLVEVSKRTSEQSKDKELKENMPLAIKSVQSAIAMLNEAATGLSTGGVQSDEDRKKLLDGSNGILNSVSLLLHVFDRSEVRKVLRGCESIMEYLQIAELVENVEEVGTFAENLASGSKTVMRQVDSRRLDLTDPSLAAILEDEVKKFGCLAMSVEDFKQFIPKFIMHLPTLVSAVKTVVDLKRSRSEGVIDAQDNRNLVVESLSKSMKEIIRVLQLTSPSEQQIDTHPHVPSLDTESTDGKNDLESLQQEALAKAMLEGGGKFCQSNILMHGPPGAGKTSLKRVILGEEPLSEENQNSTKIIENPVRAVCTYRMKKFEVINNNQIIEMLAEAIENFRVHISNPGKETKEQSSLEATCTPPASTTISQPATMHDADFQNSDVPKSPSLFFYDPSEDAEPPDFQVSDTTVTLHSISKKLKNVRPSSEMFDSQWYHLIDSGGQPQFYDILPLVHRSHSLNMVVIRLNEELDEKPKVTFHSQGRNVYKLPDKLQLTNRQFIIRMCQIASSCAKSGGPVSYVIVVGTHKDKLGKDGDKKIKEMNRELKSVYEQFKDVLIYKSNDEIIFDINTMATGKEREQYTKVLQDTISELCERRDPQPVPLKWFAFQLDLDNDEGIVRMPKCYKSGKALGMNEKDVKNALMYFDRAALLMYFPDDIPDLVLTKVDPLIDKLSDLVKASFVRPKLTLQFQCERLRNKGLFNKSFLSELFRNIPKHILGNDEFLKLLECLKIIVKLEGEEFFLPSALSFQEPSSKVCEFQMSCVPLVFSWDDYILPHGFFFTVVVELLARSKKDSDFCFTLLEGVAQWREEIQMAEKRRKIPGEVKLINRKQWIQVNYSGGIRHCSKVYKAINIAVQKAVERFKPHTGMISPTATCLCPVCKSKDHYCILTLDKKEFTCSQRVSETGNVTKAMLCWFEGSSLTIDEKMCETLKDEIASQLQQSRQRPKGIAFIFGSFDVAGALFDMRGMEDTFISLKFAVYRGQNVDPERLACLMHAAATFNYPIGCNVVAFYFAGHGGIDKQGQEFIIPNVQKQNWGSLPINQYILEPFKQLKLQKNGNERTCLFFFDCCLSESNLSHPTTNNFALKKQTFRSIVAYATVTGSKAKGDNIEGGIWTRHLVKQLQRKGVSLSTILDDTHQMVMEETKASSHKQITHYTSSASAVYLNGLPNNTRSIPLP